MDVVASSHPPVVPCVEVQLSVRHGREAVTFYEAAFGAQTCFRLGGTGELPEVVAQLQVGSTRFWVEDESPEHGNFSPQTLKGATTRLLLVVDDPAAAVQPGAGGRRPRGPPGGRGLRLAARQGRGPVRPPLGDRTAARTVAAGRRRRKGTPMRNNRSVPPATVVPVLVYPDVRAAVAFLSAAFGFAERTRIGESHRAQLAVGDDGAVIIADVGGERRPPQPGGVTHVVRVRVADVNAAFARARDHGAVVLEAPVEREYGERDCTLEDLAGHRWQLAEAVADVAPEEFGCKTVSPWPAYKAGNTG